MGSTISCLSGKIYKEVKASAWILMSPGINQNFYSRRVRTVVRFGNLKKLIDGKKTFN